MDGNLQKISGLGHPLDTWDGMFDNVLYHRDFHPQPRPEEEWQQPMTSYTLLGGLASG